MSGQSEDKVKKGNIFSTFDGYTSYLLITDDATWYPWVFLMKYKISHIETVDLFLNQDDLKAGVRRIYTDQGGELTRSSAFREVAHKNNYILETTGSYASFQNALAERPHCTCGTYDAHYATRSGTTEQLLELCSTSYRLLKTDYHTALSKQFIMRCSLAQNQISSIYVYFEVLLLAVTLATAVLNWQQT